MIAKTSGFSNIIKFFNIEDTFWDGQNTIFFPIVIDPKRAHNIGIKYFNLIVQPVTFEENTTKPSFISSNINKKSYMKSNINFPNINNSLIDNFYSKNMLLGSNQNNFTFSDQNFIYDLDVNRQEIILGRNLLGIKNRLNGDENKKFFIMIFALDKDKKILEVSPIIESNSRLADYIENNDIDIERAIGANFNSYLASTRLFVDTSNENIEFKILGNNSKGLQLHNSISNSGLSSYKPNIDLTGIINNQQGVVDRFLKVNILGLNLNGSNYNPRIANSSLEFLNDPNNLQTILNFINTNNTITLEFSTTLFSPEGNIVTYKNYKDQTLTTEEIQKIGLLLGKTTIRQNFLEGNILSINTFSSLRNNFFINRINLKLKSLFTNFISRSKLFNKQIKKIKLENIRGNEILTNDIFFYSDSFLDDNSVTIRNTKLLDIMNNLDEVNLYIKTFEIVSKISITIDNFTMVFLVSGEERNEISRFDEGVLQIFENNLTTNEAHLKSTIQATTDLLLKNAKINIEYDPVLNKYNESLEIDTSSFLENPQIKSLGYFSDSSSRTDDSLMIDFLSNFYISIAKSMEFYVNENQVPTNFVNNFIVYDRLICIKIEENKFRFNLNVEERLNYALNDNIELFTNIPGNTQNINNTLLSFLRDNNENITSIKRKIEIKVITFTKEINDVISLQNTENIVSVSNNLTSLITEIFPSYPRKKFINFVKNFIIRNQSNESALLSEKDFKRELFELFGKLSPFKIASSKDTVEEQNQIIVEDNFPGIPYTTYRQDITNYTRKSINSTDNLQFILKRSNLELALRSDILITRKVKYEDYDYLIDLRDVNNRLLNNFISQNEEISAEIHFNLNYLDISSLSSENPVNIIDDAGNNNITTTVLYENIIKETIVTRSGDLILIKIVPTIKTINYINNDFYNSSFTSFGSNNFKLNREVDTGLILKSVVGKLVIIVKNRVFEDTRIIEPSSFSFELIQEKYRNIENQYEFFNNQNLNFDKLFLNINSTNRDFYRPRIQYKKNRD